MRVAVGADHAGVLLREQVVACVREAGHDVLDLGTYTADPVDYPDCARAVGEALQEGRAERGVLICGSGVGASIAANKMSGIRAGMAHDVYSAHQGVEHDDMNLLALGARVVGPELALDLVRTFLAARFTGEERHRRRLAKVAELEHGRLHVHRQSPATDP